MTVTKRVGSCHSALKPYWLLPTLTPLGNAARNAAGTFAAVTMASRRPCMKLKMICAGTTPGARSSWNCVTKRP
jgi:hypothetical protein